MTPYRMQDVMEASSKELFKVVSLFAGCGGSSTGYRLAGGKVLAMNEFIDAAASCYSANYPMTHVFHEDVRKLHGEMILSTIGMRRGELDILDGSPPCSSFSMAGNREADWGKEKKYSDKRQRTDDLFFEYARIVSEVMPRVFVAENVKGITLGAASDMLGDAQMDMFGAHKDTIFHKLMDCGYQVQFKVLNAKRYGVPQARERTIFIGVRNDIHREIAYPKGDDSIVSVYDAIHDVVNSPKDIADATHRDGKVKSYVVQLKEGESGDQYAPSGYFGLQRVDRNKPCPTICQRQGNKGACLIHYCEDRELTINELKRLQSFPDDFILNGNYKQNCERIGRSVPPLLMKAVASCVYENILKGI